MIVEDNELNMKLFNDLLESRVMQLSRPAMAWRRSTWRGRIAPI